MTGEVIKQFLVGLGFDVDEADLAKFNKAIASASLRVAALYTSIQVAAAGIFKTIAHISEGFEQMGYEYRIIAPAISKAIELRRALLQAYAAAGINIVKVVRESVKFNFSLAKTKFALEAIYKSVGSRFIPLLTKQMDIFRGQIYANMPKIQAMLERFVKFVFKAFEATVILGQRVWSILQRVWEFFGMLDQATHGWSTRIIALIALWKLLNLTFLRTPLGMILVGLLAILALYDDFMTFKEGGESLINWGSNFAQVLLKVAKVVGVIAAAIGAVRLAFTLWGAALSFVRGVIFTYSAVMGALEGVIWAVNFALAANPIGLMVAGFIALIGIIGLVIYKWSELKAWFSSFFEWVSGKVSAFAQSIPSFFSHMNPFASGGSANPHPLTSPNNGVNQKVSQETHINVQGSPDANATGRAVANEQGKVNFDLTRNLRGATQ